MIKVSEYIVNFLIAKEIDVVFTISGGFIAPILHSLNGKIKYYCFNHEQAAAMAADGYYRTSRKPACLLITNGPGSTNTITGVVGAFQDSVPIFIISGNVPFEQGIHSQHLPLRQLGVQEVNILPLIQTITNYSVCITDKNEIPIELEKAYNSCIHGRMGPSWIDVPLDIQNEFIPDSMKEFDQFMEVLKKSSKPLLLIGNGIHLSHSEELFINFVKQTNIPFVSSWLAKDVSNELYFGNIGIFGERFSNFALQTCDVLIVLGCRLNITHIGYDYANFSKKSFKIMVDIDKMELDKKTISIDLKINENLFSFFNKATFTCEKKQEWIDQLVHWKNKYPTFDSRLINGTERVNSYFFAEKLSLLLKENTTIVTDTGTSSFTIFQYLSINKPNIRLFTASGQSCMGYGLPGAIGACIADPSKQTLLISGDGGFQFNIQELQTMVYYNLNIKIFIFDNNGYLAIKLMQNNLYYDLVGCDNTSGVSSPDFVEIAKAYKIKDFILHCNNDIDALEDILNYNGPCICLIKMVEDQLLQPRIYKKSLEFMCPFIDENELRLENVL